MSNNSKSASAPTVPGKHRDPSATHILDFKQTSHVLSKKSTAFATRMLQQMLPLFADLGFKDEPAGRRAAYADAVSWDDLGRQAMIPPNPGAGSSSCAMFIRNLWWLLGARGPEMEETFVPQRIFPLLFAYAQRHDARRVRGTGFTRESFDPKPGDALFIFRPKTETVSASQHIFIIARVQRITSGADPKLVIESVDGGQAGENGKDKPCCGIAWNQRSLPLEERDDGSFICKSLRFADDSKQRTVHTWIPFDKLRAGFSGPMTEVVRNAANAELGPGKPVSLPLPDPESPPEVPGVPDSAQVQLRLEDPVLRPSAGTQAKLTFTDDRSETVAVEEGGVIQLETFESAASMLLDGQDEKDAETVFIFPPDIATPEGVWQRLVNLGYARAAPTVLKAPDDETLALAVEAFQINHDRDVTGELGDADRELLVQLHDNDERPWGELDLPEPDPEQIDGPEPKAEVS